MKSGEFHMLTGLWVATYNTVDDTYPLGCMPCIRGMPGRRQHPLVETVPGECQIGCVSAIGKGVMAGGWGHTLRHNAGHRKCWRECTVGLVYLSRICHIEATEFAKSEATFTGR